MRTKKRNAPAGAATPARARNEDFAVNHSGFNSNTDGRKTPQIFALLHTGAENGTTLRELVAATGLNERVVRLKIQQERKDGKGHPADPAGHGGPERGLKPDPLPRHDAEHRAQMVDEHGGKGDPLELA